jgi:hypothetical protein
MNICRGEIMHKESETTEEMSNAQAEVLLFSIIMQNGKKQN